MHTLKRSRQQPQPKARHVPLLDRSGGRRYTPGEQRAWRAGFIAGIEHAQSQLELFRIRVGVRGVEIDVPEFWPEVSPSPAAAWSTKP